MAKMLKFLFPLTLYIGTLFAQNIEANWQANFIWNTYTYVARDSLSPYDTSTTLDLNLSWPSSNYPLYTQAAISFEPGDTVTSIIQPLLTEGILAYFGVVLNTDFNNDGTFTINPSQYPTTGGTDICSTYSAPADIQESGYWTSGPGYWHTEHADPWGAITGTGGSISGEFYSYGNGIGESGVFPNYEPVDITTGTYGVDFGADCTSDDCSESWGRTTLGYTDDTHEVPNFMEIFWENHYGPVTGSGWDEVTEEITDNLGIGSLPGDTVTIPMTAALAATYGIDINVATDYPMAGGPGLPTDSVSWITGEVVNSGTVSNANNFYVFDPIGGDGTPFSGDEPFKATGYYATYNYLEAAGYFQAVFEGLLGYGFALDAALIAASDSVASIYVGEDTSAAVGTEVGTAVYDQYIGCVGAYGQDACAGILQFAPTEVLAATQAACEDCYINDSDTLSGWIDYYGYNIPTPGRLVFQADNSCIAVHTTNAPTSRWYNTALVEIDNDAPVAEKFELHGNFPNPFNPSTAIKFSTEKFTNVTVNIYSLLGQKVKTLHNSELAAGTYDVKWYGKDAVGNKVPSGVYFYEVVSDNRIQKGKMLLLK